MQWNFVNIYKILFPPTDDEKMLEKQTLDTFTQKLRITHINDTLALLSYKDPAVRSAIHLNKFHGHAYAQQLLSHVLYMWLHTYVDTPYIVIPIPLSKQRLRTRGFNQSQVIAERALKNIPTIPIVDKVLIRTKNTPPQTSLQKEARMQNMQEAFIVKDGKQLQDKHVILFDDVVTTGATLHSAKNALMLHSPASVTCVALAH